MQTLSKKTSLLDVNNLLQQDNQSRILPMLTHKNLKTGGIYALGGMANGAIASNLLEKAKYTNIDKLVGSLAMHAIGKIGITLMNKGYSSVNPPKDYDIVKKLIMDAIQSALAAIPSMHLAQATSMLLKEAQLSSAALQSLTSGVLFGTYLYSYCTAVEKLSNPLENSKCIKAISNNSISIKVEHIHSKTGRIIGEILVNTIAGLCATKSSEILQSLNPQENYAEQTARYAFTGIVFSAVQTLLQGSINKVYSQFFKQFDTKLEQDQELKTFSLL